MTEPWRCKDEGHEFLCRMGPGSCTNRWGQCNADETVTPCPHGRDDVANCDECAVWRGER